MPGFFLGPVLYGALFDASCLVWQETCGERGSCWIYDTTKLAWYMLAILLSIKVCGMGCLTLALYTYKPPPEDEDSKEDTGAEIESGTPLVAL